MYSANPVSKKYAANLSPAQLLALTLEVDETPEGDSYDSDYQEGGEGSCDDGSYEGDPDEYDPCDGDSYEGDPDEYDPCDDFVLDCALDEWPMAPPTEDTWDDEVPDTYFDEGVSKLRWLMENVKARDLCKQDILWVVAKHLCISGWVTSGLFSEAILKDPSYILSRYAIALETELRKNGIGYETFGGLTPEGYAVVDAIVAKQKEAAQ